MSRSLFAAFCLILLAVSLPETSASAQVIKDHYIVLLRPGVNTADVARGYGVNVQKKYSHVINGFAAELPAQALQGLRHNPNVVAVQPDRLVMASAQVLPTGVGRIGADLEFTPAPVNAGVAVIDTGIDLDHPDLNVAAGVNCLRIDRKTGDCSDGGDDDNGHGSHVAGTIGAFNDSNGVVGVAPGVRLFAVKVLDRKGSGTLSSVIMGMDWVARNAASHGINVVNLSLGGTGLDDTDGNPDGCQVTQDAEHQALCALIDAGITVVVAAGNESDDTLYHTPGAFDEVITVSAFSDFDGLPGGLGEGVFAFSSCTESEDDSFGCFSNYGHDVDIMAPGMGIYSTYKNGGYATMSGTSMATPHVAGAAAVILGNDPTLSHYQVREQLLANADPAPCATVDGICLDDPDGIQEPLLMVGVPQPSCALDLECDDGVFCNGVELCMSGVCVSGNAPCDDGIECTQDSCDEGVQTCGFTALDSACDDGNECTDEVCSSVAGCEYSFNTNPCDDEDVCTLGDVCDAGLCVGAVDPNCDECGDMVCAGGDLGEDCNTCPTDCACIGKNCKNGCCGNGVCDKSETLSSCPVDCI